MAGANISPTARRSLAADRMPFADDVTAATDNMATTWRSSVQDGGVMTSPTITPGVKMWSLPDARRTRVVNALKGMYTLNLLFSFHSTLAVGALFLLNLFNH